MARSWVSVAFTLSWVSLVLTIIAFVCGLVVSGVTSSSATLGFALENAVDFLSSALVCWRFWGGGKAVPEAQLEQREKRASVGIAISFVILAFVVGGVAIGHLSTHERPSDVTVLIALSVPSAIAFGLLGGLKMWVGQATSSASMKKDAACSLCGAVLSLGVIVGALAVGADERLWFVDALVAVVVALLLLSYGCFVLVKNAKQNNAWWTWRFWQESSVTSRAARHRHAGQMTEIGEQMPRHGLAESEPRLVVAVDAV